nr:hypothetical protein [Pseudenhygromyxa sp. WMMC2535]
MRLLEPAEVVAVTAREPGRERPIAAQLADAIAKYGAAEGLARVRTREYLRLARRELEHGPLEEIGGALSDLAGACVDAAMAAVDPQLRARVVVFGMGKLGGRELNFLSDIDLIFVHADDALDAEDEGAAHRERTQLHAQLRQVLRLLEGSGPWRPLFHVDLRLRPFGTRGPLSISASALERYYERHGRSWERQAWLRAWPIAGDLQLGEQVLRGLAPFVWPRTMDPSMFEDIRSMMKRARAEAHRGLGAAAIDIKHDAGGIREIEFFVQSLQLLNGGRHPSVRARSTLAALDRLAASGFISDREHEVLGGAYRVLRRIEHRLQLAEGHQTHRLPQDDGDRDLLARRLAVSAPPRWLLAPRDRNPERRRERADGQRFDLSLAELRGLVQSITGTLTGESELVDEGEAEREIVQAVLVDPGASSGARRKALERIGLWPTAAEEATAVLDHLLSRPESPLVGSGPARAGARALLLACLDSANPVAALRRLVEFTSTRPAHLGLWRLMAEAEHQPLVRQLADLFGASEPLSRGVIGLPGTSGGARDGGLSLLLEATAAVGLADADALRERFASFELRAAPGAPPPSLDERLLLFKHRELVRIGLYDLGRRPDPLVIGRHLSDLAELIVAELLADLASDVRPSADQPQPFTLAVFTLGKFGMQAMDYGSDLDLVFVFDPAPSVSPTLAREAAQKVSRRLIARLEDRIHGARLYEVDTRLRPSGRQGLLVSSLDGFRSYHARSVEIWERLALVRLRAVAEARFGELDPADGPAHASGPAPIGPLSRAVLDEVVPASLWPAEEPPGAIAAETRRLKRRIEDELARETRDTWDIKSGRGGCLELELLTSALQLRHARDPRDPKLRSRDIPTALTALAAAGVLADSEAQGLVAAYRFQRLLLNRLRMTRGSGWGLNDRLPVNSPRLTALARRMGLADRDALITTLERQRSVVRAAFDRHLAADDTHAGAH